MSTIPNPVQAAIERLNVIRALFLGKIADNRERQGYVSQDLSLVLEGRIEAYTDAAHQIAKALKDIQRDSNHRQDSTRSLWLIDPMGRNNPEEND